MPSENEQRVQDFVASSKSLLDQWAAQTGAALNRYDAGTLSADDVARAWAAASDLALKGWGVVLGALLDMAPATPVRETAGPFPVPQNLQGSTYRLQLAGPLEAAVGGSQIPVSLVRLVPDQLTPTETDFRIEVTTAGLDPVLYTGSVQLLDADGQVVASVAVQIAVT